MNSSESFTFKIIDNIQEINSVKDFWISKQWHPWTDFDYYVNIVIHEKGILKPNIIVVYENKTPIFLLIGNIIVKDYKLKLGYKSIFGIKSKYLKIMYGGILGDQSPKVCRETIYFIKNILSKEKIDYVFFKELDTNSELFKASKNFGGKFIVSKIDIPNPHLYLDIPESYEKFLYARTQKERQNIRRNTKKLEKDFKGRFEIKLYQNLEDADTIMSDTNEIASKTYQSKLGATMFDDKITRDKIQYELQNKRFYVWIMYIEKKPVAYWICIVYGKTCLGSKTGYLQEYNQYRPGLHLFSIMIEYFCKTDFVNRFDFGFGDAAYKRRYYSSILIESNVFIYTSNLKGALLNLMGLFNRVTILLYRNLQKRYKIVVRFKKKSRDKLINRQ